MLHRAERGNVGLDHRMVELHAARCDERRRLLRDLHDGAQQSLIVLGLKVALAESLSLGASDELRRLLGEIRSDLTDAMSAIRGVVGGSPHLLDVHGLRAALVARAQSAPLSVDIGCAELRYPAEVESSVFFCCSEAIQNVVKHAGASRCSVRVWHAGDRLWFEVGDDGRGFDPARRAPGAGLRNLHDRVTALGGELDVRSHAGAGTTVRGWVSLAERLSLMAVE